MPLIQLWEKTPDIVLQYNIKQIVSAAGEGVLSDGSECSRELRHYLRNIPAEKLYDHVDYCLSNSFDKSGLVLQDIINELGRRLCKGWVIHCWKLILSYNYTFIRLQAV